MVFVLIDQLFLYGDVANIQPVFLLEQDQRGSRKVLLNQEMHGLSNIFSVLNLVDDDDDIEQMTTSVSTKDDNNASKSG